MKIAIDLNDVIRAYTKNFAKVYKREYNREIDEDNLEVTTNDLSKVFHFDSDAEYRRFVYEDFPFEIFGKCETINKQTATYFNKWMEELKNLDVDEEINVMIVSTMEYGLTIQSTYFFLSKIGCRVREIYLPTDSTTIWDRCDLLVTANPKLLKNKPEDKKVIKIETDYNRDIEGDESYGDVCDFFMDANKVLNYIN